MPKYSFICDNCGKQLKKFTSSETREIQCDSCDHTMQRKMPTLASGTEVKELIDEYSGVSRNQDHDSIIKERRDQHYWEVLVPEFIQKYSLETCLENKWLTYNEKGELVINKPPSKR